MKLHHIGYITGNIAETAKAFEALGYVQQPVFDDTIQKCIICFLKRDVNDSLIELVQPYEDNKTMQNILTKKGGDYLITFAMRWRMYRQLMISSQKLKDGLQCLNQ